MLLRHNLLHNTYFLAFNVRCIDYLDWINVSRILCTINKCQPQYFTINLKFISHELGCAISDHQQQLKRRNDHFCMYMFVSRMPLSAANIYAVGKGIKNVSVSRKTWSFLQSWRSFFHNFSSQKRYFLDFILSCFGVV